jgi:predicted enzyme related to lactoylglutathione lyase
MPGKIVHFELPAADADRASGFWNGLFGWDVGGSAMEGFDYRMFQVADDQGGAVYPAEDNAGSGPIVYFDTDDIEASIAKVRELGGEAEDKAPVPGHGWFASCRDTEGNRFSLWQGDEAATMTA